jgi:membrane protein implicated in regulation of membrane protease activity
MTSDDRGTTLRYVVAALPGWFAAMAVAYGVHRWADVPAWAAILLPGLWIAVDVVMYPARRRFYESEPPYRWLVGEAGVALTQLQPEGLVRVRGEIWLARVPAGSPAIAKASGIRVRGIEGLRVIVEPEPPARR